MPTLTQGLADIATRAGRQAVNRRLTGTSGLVGRVSRAARSYAQTLGRTLRPRRHEATHAVQQLARQITGDRRSGAPPIVPGLAEQIQARQTASVMPQQSAAPYSAATEQLQQLAGWILDRAYIGDQEAQQLANRVVGLLRRARSDPAVGLDQRRALEDIAVWLEHRFQPPAAPPTSQQDSNEPEEGDWGGRANIGAWSDEEIQGAMSKERLTPGSSNVYSYFWVPDRAVARREGMSSSANGTLFVTFLAYHPGMSKRRGGSGKRPHVAGPTYAYSNVPFTKFSKFEEDASGSAGGAVWEYLRVRGSRFGHQHPYRLVAGVQVPDGGQYIPRKVTATGLRRRALLDPRAGWSFSNLPESRSSQREQGFSYAQWRDIAATRNLEHSRGVNRGRPSVDRGRP